MQNLITYSLYGHVAKYTLGLFENLQMVREIYPGWDVRVYIDCEHYAIDMLKTDYPWVQVFVRSSVKGSGGMFWRFEPIFELAYDRVIVRDVDSRPSEREALLVKEWVESERSIHCIRDHKEHRHTPVLGGACGFYPKKIRHLRDSYIRWNHSYQYGDDELYLRKQIYEQLSTDEIFVHSSLDSKYERGDETKQIDPCDNFICKPVPPRFEPFLKRLYVLNAPHYKNRYIKFVESLKRSEILSNLEVVRVEGCYLKDEPVPSWFNQEHKHWWLASQDHKRLLKQLISQKEDLALIFEDDGIPTTDFDEYFVRAWNRADPDKLKGDTHNPWTSLMLGGQQDDKRGYINEDLAIATGGYGQHSILYNYSGLKGFYDHAMYWNYETIDVAYAGYQRQFQNTYCPAKWITNIEGVQFGKDN